MRVQDGQGVHPDGPQPVSIATKRGTVEYAPFGDGPAVLSLHGAAGGYDQGLILARTIGGPGFRFLAVSRPGYFGTPLAVGPTPDAQADAVAAVLDALGIRTAAVMAVSGGGPCALQFALRHPQRCWALVMASACSAPLLSRPPLSFRLLPLIARSATLVWLMRARTARDLDRGLYRGITDPALRARTLADPETGPLLRELTLGMFDRLAERMAGTFNDIEQARLLPDLPFERIGAATLIVHGTRDPLVPFAQAQTLAARIPGAEILALQDAEHAAVFTHRDEIRRRVTTFLAAYTLRAA